MVIKYFVFLMIIFNLNGCMDTAIRFWNNTGGYAVNRPDYIGEWIA